MRILMLCVLAAVLAGGNAGAADGQNDGQDALRAYFESVRTLSGRFEQVTRDERGEVVETSVGEFAIERPDRFNWFYETPFEQRIVADGRWLYVHDIELAQVTVRPFDEVLGVGPALLLSGDYEALKASFEIAAADDGWYRLTPTRGEWDFQSVRLRMADGVPQVVAVNDGLGQTTRLELTKVVRNEPIPDARFRFTVPDGVDVIAPPAFEGEPRR